jgi:RNA polymerase sigma factor (sigma-70 family)
MIAQPQHAPFLDRLLAGCQVRVVQVEAGSGHKELDARCRPLGVLAQHAGEDQAIRSPTAFLNTVVTRLCLNQLASARARSEAYVGLCLPDPVLSEKGALLDRDTDPVARQAELHESISLAFLVLLEQLTPLERAVFLLREVFEYSYAEIAAIVEKDEVACRQIFSRARKQIAAQRPRFSATAEQYRQILGHFVLASTRYLPPNYHTEIAEVNGQPAAIVYAGQQILLLIALDVDHNQVYGIRVVGNPEKLRGL